MPRKLEAAPLAPSQETIEVDHQQGQDALGNEARFVQPSTYIKPVEQAVSNQSPEDPLAQLQAMLSPEVLQNLISAGVQQYLAANPVTAPKKEASPVAPMNPNPALVVPHNYLKHYRNSRSPEIEYLELDMSVLEDGQNPSFFPKKGQYIRFHRGHFYATTENQVKQLDWLSQRDTISGDGVNVIGGDPALYEDDGEDIIYCPVGCSHAEYHFASMKSLGAHMRSVHHMDIGVK